MERKIENTILKWKNSSKRIPLIIKGVRQIGKIYTALISSKNTIRIRFTLIWKIFRSL